MKRVLKRLVFLRFTAGLRGIYDRNSWLATLLRLPGIRHRWLESVSSHMVIFRISGVIACSKGSLQMLTERDVLSESKTRGHLAWVLDMVVIGTKIGLRLVGFVHLSSTIRRFYIWITVYTSMNQCAKARFIFFGNVSVLEHSMRLEIRLCKRTPHYTGKDPSQPPWKSKPTKPKRRQLTSQP